MAGRQASTTRAETIYAELKADILLGRRRPGERIRLKDLADERGVSLTVVREAVTRLAAEGSAVANPQQGFRVRSISVPDLVDLTWIRVQLETLALRESIMKGDLAWEAQLVAAHHTLSSIPLHPYSDEPQDAWRAAHDRFHAALTAACGSPILLQIRQQLFDASELYRAWSGTLVEAEGSGRPVSDEHSEILEAALARDADRATALVAAHLQRTTQILVEAADRRPPEVRTRRPVGDGELRTQE
jgi:GntR family transcriptional regulator, carbon starvation induced regulator